MCEHVYLTGRAGEQISYRLMDCTKLPSGELACKLEDRQLAHLMASSQFKKIEVVDVEGIPEGAESTMDLSARTRTYREADFPAFVAKVLGAAGLPPKAEVKPLSKPKGRVAQHA